MQMIEGHKAIDAPQGVQSWDIDPYAAEHQCDRGWYAELCARGPFVHLSRYGMLACGRYDVVREVFSDHTRFVSSRGVGLQDFAMEKPWRPASIVLEVDPPYHTKTRRAIQRALSPKVVAGLRDVFADSAASLVDDLLGREIDGVADLAEAFPTKVFPRAVGLRLADRRKLVDYGAMVFNALGPDNDQRRAAMAHGPEIVPWVTEQCRRENLDPGGIGAVIYESADAGDITPEEAGMLVRSLLSAGVDTTVTALGNALWAFGTWPEQFDRLRANPDLALPAFEEVIRLTSPVAAFCRTAATDTEVAGVPIVEGTKILCVLGAANLDTDQWGADAAAFDVTRKTAGHLALGVGVHGCVGQTIARAEGQAVLRALAEKVTRVELTGTPEWRPNNAMHALDRLPVRLVEQL